MASRYTSVEISDFDGGRNAADDPMSLDETQVSEARNGDWHRSTGFRKRKGSTQPAIGSAFAGVIRKLLTHTPGEPSANELWAVDDATPEVVGRMAAATTFTAVTLEDAITSAPSDVQGASFNGKHFLAYASAVDRLHCYDPDLSSPSVRRVGLGAPTVPTATDTGSGSYAAVLRYYRTRSRIKNGAIVLAQSEPSASVAETPSSSGTHSRVTYVTTDDDAEVTHWVLEASDDDITFFEVPSGETVIGTLTFDDNTDVTTYSNGVLSAAIGGFVPPKGWRYVRAAFNRLFGIGSFTSTERQSRLYYTTAEGASDPPRGDDERVPRTVEIKNEKDLDEGNGGRATGFAGPLNGALYAFKYSQIWKIVPTGVSDNPLDIIDITKVRGATNQEAICEGLDQDGRSVVYFVDPAVGPSVLGAAGPIAISGGIRDFWDGPNATVNLEATKRVADCVFVPHRGKAGQVWFWWSIASDNEPTFMAVFDIAGQGWSEWSTGGQLRQNASAVMFARTPGASMSRDQTPYISHSTENNVILRGDTTDTDDDSTAFKAFVKSKPIVLNQGAKVSLGTPVLLAEAATGVTLTVTYDLDFGRVVRSATVSIQAEGSETHVLRQLDDLQVSGEQARIVQVQIGDASAISNAWAISRIYVPITKEEVNP